MSMVSKDTSKRLFAIHGWSGVILGLFLYVVIITGVVTVLAHEVGEWSVSGAPVASPLSQPVDARIKELAKSVDERYLEDVSISVNTAGSLIVFFHTHATNTAGKPDDLGVRFILKPGSLETLRRDEGFGTELPGDPQNALSHFITRLHVTLHAPDPVGLYLTGIAGFVMLFAVISGMILHKHLLKDLFVAPRLSSRLLNRRDRHILAASWSLPFGFLLAFTGTFFSFAGAIGLPIVAAVSFGGDQTKMLETLVGVPQAQSNEKAQMVNLDTLLASSAARTGMRPESANVVHWGKADAKLLITHRPQGASIEGSNHIYRMATGAYEGVKPDVGTQPSLGSKVFAWMTPLHFGHFAGLLSKFIWVALGLAACYVTLSGLRLWVERRAEQAGWGWLGDAIAWVGYGVPLGMAGSAAGFLLAARGGELVAWTGWGFVAGAALAVVIAVFGRVFLRKAQHSLISVRSVLQIVLAASMMALPLLRLATGGMGWPALIASGQLIPIMVDLVLLIGGACILMMARARSDEIALAGESAEPDDGDGDAEDDAVQPAFTVAAK